jgi:hypothetical protein
LDIEPYQDTHDFYNKKRFFQIKDYQYRHFGIVCDLWKDTKPGIVPKNLGLRTLLNASITSISLIIGLGPSASSNYT